MFGGQHIIQKLRTMDRTFVAYISPVLLIITIVYANEPPKLEIPNGWLQGTFEKSYNGRLYSSFQGIPYARPPVSELRFEPPKEAYNWTGVLIANTKHSCMYMKASTLIGDEDCLYLNVYVPKTNINSSDNLNVIVHIHGGGFNAWDSNYYSGAKYLMDEDVIFVTINYRLGALGFLSTGDSAVPGNNGLKDQTLALKWIQKNIMYFGGNPHSVTITGMSAGAVSVHLHYFSQLSKGLFHRGVSQSGVASTVFIRNPFTQAKILAEEIGCDVRNSTDIVSCLRTRSAKQIVDIQGGFMSNKIRQIVSFGPVLEKEAPNAFLTQTPYKMLLDKTVTDLPWIVSNTEVEGTFIAGITPVPVSELIKNFDQVGPTMFLYNDLPEDDQKLISRRIKEHYLVERQDDKAFIDIFDDILLKSPADTAAKLQALANKSPVYFYIFGYRGQHSFLDHLIPKTDHIRLTHGDDCLYYLHSSKTAEETLTKSDEQMKSIFLKWLTSFADGQEPKIDGKVWKPVTGNDGLEFLYFKSPEDVHNEVVEDFGNTALWNQLPLADTIERKRMKDEL